MNDIIVISDYLYRVESYHAGTAGSSKSAWIATRSGQGGEMKQLKLLDFHAMSLYF